MCHHDNSCNALPLDFSRCRNERHALRTIVVVLFQPPIGLSEGWISACVELLQPPTETAVNTDSNNSIVMLPFRLPLGYCSGE